MDTSLQLVLKIAASVAIGLLIGLEREWAHKDAGVRTFALVALLGACAWIVAPMLAYVQFSIVVLVILLVNGYAWLKRRGLQITTSVALAATNVLGIALGGGNFFFAFAGAVAIAALLSWKTELITLSSKLTEGEIRGALLLLFLSIIVYPLLPSQPVDPWKILDLRSVWLTVVLVSWLKFVNYILLRQFGERGIRYSALLGGLVNSAAMALFLGQEVRAGAEDEQEAPGNVLLAGTAMILRNWLLVALFSLPQGFQRSLPTVMVLFPMTLVGGGMAGLEILLVYRRARSRSAEQSPAQGASTPQPDQVEAGNDSDARQDEQQKKKRQIMQSPLALRSVLGFALLFLSLTVASGAAKIIFGTLGFLSVVVVGALASAASSAILAGQELARGVAGSMPVAIAMFLATVLGLLENVVIFWLTTRKTALGLRIVLWTLPIIAVGALLVFVIH